MDIKPRARRKMSREQICEILERNVQLYKGEDSFVNYLVDLALYLVEYEYDWSQSELDKPREAAQANSAPEQAELPPRPRVVSIHSNNNGGLRPLKRNCPYCGNIVGEALVCPSCRNLTR